VFDGLAISHLASHLHAGLSPSPISSALPVVVQNFKDFPTDTIALFWTKVAAGASIAAAVAAFLAVFFAAWELSILSRKAKLRVSFAHNSMSVNIRALVRSWPSGNTSGIYSLPLPPGSSWDHRWSSKIGLVLHNFGRRTAPDALIRLAFPIGYQLDMGVVEDDLAEIAGERHVVYALQEPLPIYPGVPRQLNDIGIVGTPVVATTAEREWHDDLPVVPIYCQIGSADGVDPGVGKWTALSLKPISAGAEPPVPRVDLLLTLSPNQPYGDFSFKGTQAVERKTWSFPVYLCNNGLKDTSKPVHSAVLVPVGYQPENLKNLALNQPIEVESVEYQLLTCTTTLPIFHKQFFQIGSFDLIGSPGTFVHDFKWRLSTEEGVFPSEGYASMRVFLT